MSWEKQREKLIEGSAQGPALVKFTKDNMPADLSEHPSPALFLSIDPHDLPPGMEVYRDTNGRLSLRYTADTAGLRHVTVDSLPAYSEEYVRALTENTCTPVTAALTDQAIYCCTATLTADANGDLGVLNTGQITPDVSSFNIRLLKVESAVTLTNTAGAARCEVISNDATPKIWTNPDLGDSMTFPRIGNQKNAAVNKHWAVIGGGLTAAADYTFYAWFRAED